MEHSNHIYFYFIAIIGHDFDPERVIILKYRKGNNMEYHIKLEDGSTLASFVNEHDRNSFLDVLREDYDDMPDGYFTPVDES